MTHYYIILKNGENIMISCEEISFNPKVPENRISCWIEKVCIAQFFDVMGYYKEDVGSQGPEMTSSGPCGGSLNAGGITGERL